MTAPTAAEAQNCSATGLIRAKSHTCDRYMPAAATGPAMKAQLPKTTKESGAAAAAYMPYSCLCKAAQAMQHMQRAPDAALVAR